MTILIVLAAIAALAIIYITLYEKSIIRCSYCQKVLTDKRNVIYATKQRYFCSNRCAAEYKAFFARQNGGQK